MNNKILISVLSAIVIGLIIIPSSIAGSNGLLPFMIGATIICGIVVVFLLGFLNSLFSAQREYGDLMSKNSLRQVSLLEALLETLGKYQKENGEMLNRISSEQFSTLNQISKDIISSLKEMETQFNSKIERLTAKSCEAKDEITTAIIGATENVNIQLMKRNELETNALKDFIDKFGKSYKEIVDTITTEGIKLNEGLNNTTVILEQILNGICEVKTSTGTSINGLAESIDNQFENLIRMNALFEKSISTINNSIEQFFKDNDNIGCH